jgi:hypothetical protein
MWKLISRQKQWKIDNITTGNIMDPRNVALYQTQIRIWTDQLKAGISKHSQFRQFDTFYVLTAFKWKRKVNSVHSMKAYKDSRGVAPYFVYFGGKRNFVKITPRPLYLR